ncbi:MAG: SpoIID/LytB domain-containing protein [Alkalispirochaetaceae bacterium]
MRRNLMAILLAGFVAASCAEAQEIPTPEEAVRAWYAGNHAEAIEGFRALLDTEPRNPARRLNLLVLLREAGRMEEAVEVAAGLDGAAEALPPGVATAERLATLILAGRERETLELAPEELSPGTDSANRSVPTDTPPVTETAPPSPEPETIAARTLLWQGVAQMLSGESQVALDRFTEAERLQPHLPYASLFRGELLLRRGEYNEAVRELEGALVEDRNLTGALLPLARAKRALGEEEEAYRLLRRAEVALPWNREISELREQWEREFPRLAARREAEAEERRAIAVPPVVEPEPVAVESIPRLRVGLAEGLSSLFIKTGGAFTVIESDPDLALLEPEDREAALGHYLEKPPLLTGEGGQILEVSARGGDIALLDESGETVLVSPVPLRLRYREPGRTTTLFDLTYGEGQFFGGREDRSYRGAMEILPGPGGAFTVVNELNVEEYLYSVVPSEMPAFWPEEALEAQAVAARSYTLHRRDRYRRRGFDLVSSVASAHYRGVTGEHPRTTAAVRETRGELLVTNGQILDAVYSANSAGYTESSESVWGSATPLVAVSDPLLPPIEDPRSPLSLYAWLLSRPESYSSRGRFSSESAYRWRILVPREEIERRLKERGQSVGTVKRIIPGRRGVTGRVESVTITGSEGETTIHRDAIRSALGGLRSNLFLSAPRLDASGAAEAFLFEGAGWGHGVGMCQSGAAGMAEAGQTHGEVLRHYYPESELEIAY